MDVICFAQLHCLITDLQVKSYPHIIYAPMKPALNNFTIRCECNDVVKRQMVAKLNFASICGICGSLCVSSYFCSSFLAAPPDWKI